MSNEKKQPKQVSRGLLEPSAGRPILHAGLDDHRSNAQPLDDGRPLVIEGEGWKWHIERNGARLRIRHTSVYENDQLLVLPVCANVLEIHPEHTVKSQRQK